MPRWMILIGGPTLALVLGVGVGVQAGFGWGLATFILLMLAAAVVFAVNELGWATFADYVRDLPWGLIWTILGITFGLVLAVWLARLLTPFLNIILGTLLWVSVEAAIVGWVIAYRNAPNADKQKTLRSLALRVFVLGAVFLLCAAMYGWAAPRLNSALVGSPITQRLPVPGWVNYTPPAGGVPEPGQPGDGTAPTAPVESVKETEVRLDTRPEIGQKITVGWPCGDGGLYEYPLTRMDILHQDVVLEEKGKCAEVLVYRLFWP